MERKETDQGLRFEADDRPSLPLTIGLGLQNTALTLASVVLTPTILITTAGAGDAYLNWALFAALVVSGTATFIQAMRFGRIGAGYILVMGSTAAYLAVGISAVRSGGPELMATLIVVA
ncbi:MAG: xanthine/uracil/vitamin C permease, partial [Gammaproteobacteria bacterium]|nr:xanthine/uracil/vitamin C permease [Gammaproteobacteria bacterium]